MYDLKKTAAASTITEALELMENNPGAVLTAGGTDVFIKLNGRKLKNASLIYIREIPELFGIRKEADGSLWIGPATPFDTIYRSELLRSTIPMLCYACNQVGSPQIRHIATIGGNLCNGAVSADSVPSLLALDAELELTSKNGKRYLSVCDFHTGPGKTVLDPAGELLTAIRIPRDSYEGWTGKYFKFGQRNAMEISTLGCAATVQLSEDKKRLETLRIAFGVAAPVPVRCRKLEESVSGMEIDQKLFEQIHDRVLEELKPRDSWRASLELREQLIKTLSVRAVKDAIQQQGGEIDV